MSINKLNLNRIMEDERYKKRIQRFRTETLRIIMDDRNKAREYVRKSVERIDPQNLKNKYIETMVDGMQQLAEIILEKRGKAKTKN